ncbi:hypothetical protein [Novipirellula rosea]|uniref:Spore coat protein U domain-containing protein n=1 Tax=Novipirellula rosea TaxID=1031540 RepID=A0ABP8MGD5_9BACT
MHTAVRTLVLLGLSIGIATQAQGQTSASVDFCVNVQNALAILAPNGPISLNHDGTAGIKSFAPQTFSAVCNDGDGATVTFGTVAGFVHNTLPLVTRDVKLDLAIASSDTEAGWTVDVVSDQSDITNLVPDLSSQVQASSSGPGNVELQLTVSMDSGSVTTLVPGTYCTTVYATITAN